MKRLLIPLLFLILLPALTTFAQDNTNLITLNDTSPAIDVVITLPADTTGTISLKLAYAAVTLTDSNNAVVFQAADARLHAIELNIAPNSGSHTLKVERLPGLPEAYVNIESLPELSIAGTVQRITGKAVAINEEIALTLDTNNPGSTTSVSIPDGTTGVMTATFPGSYATTQLVDAQGIVLARSGGGHVDGLNLVLDAGNYQYTLLGSNLTGTVVAGVRLVSAADTGISVFKAPAPAENVVANTTDGTCTAIINRSAVNLRSGPGTGYSITGYGYLNEPYKVGGRNPENNWIVVGTNSGSAWLALTGVDLQGTCDALTLFNVPLRDAQVAPIIITTAQQSNTNSGEHEEHEDHEENEHERDHDD